MACFQSSVRTRRATGAIALLAAGACSHAARPLPTAAPVAAGVPDCDGRIAVAAADGRAPRFTWAPDCVVRSLAVQTADDAHTDLWVVNVPEPGGIRSGIAYGAAPAGAAVSAGPRPLKAGRAYLVTVRTITGGGSWIVAEGDAVFRP